MIQAHLVAVYGVALVVVWPNLPQKKWQMSGSYWRRKDRAFHNRGHALQWPPLERQVRQYLGDHSWKHSHPYSVNKSLARTSILLLSVDVRQRLGKRPHTPERHRSVSPVPPRNAATRREPLTDVHSRLGTTKHESRGLYSEPTKDKKSGKTK